MPVLSVTTIDEFKALIKENPKAVADFYASWCSACKTMTPVFEDLSNKYPDVTFISVDVDDGEDLAHEQGITAMPTFKLFDNGEMIEEIVGAKKPALLTAMTKLAQPPAPVSTDINVSAATTA
ncbi:mitochondrial thioredoxin [Coemansia interrupta]|uniref:Mitochondrial thioredoxin n=1 Tax=Coemansia interrupta TaxID=1126814 RepID=A0A9W8HN15_9FUNG|nr:mitochondrial thioredoxin [Coemansia interrupta]